MIDINSLTAEQRRELMKQMQEEEKQKEELRKQRIEDYKTLVEEVVERNFKKALELADKMLEIKIEIFEDFKTLLELKAELYGIKESQQSHTFTTKAGKSIILGHRVLDNFDDTVHAGIQKVKNYINRLTAGEKNEIEELINLLLKKDKNGNLKANRVLELERIASKIDDVELKEGVQIIKEAYQPVKSSDFIEVYYKTANGKRVNVPLSMTSIGGNDDREIEKTDDNESTN